MTRSLLQLRLHLGALVMLLALTGCSERATLFNGLSEQEANEVYSHLLDAGIPAEKARTKEGLTITVPENLSATALGITQAKGLPRDKKSSIGQVFKKENMISSPLEERARYLYALSQELEDTLMRIDGVLSAKVHIVLPERANPGEALSPSSAAVFVKYAEKAQFPAYIPKVREMVFKSIPGITGDAQSNVTVTAIPSEPKIDECVPLVWYGPMALSAADKGYFLAIVYIILLMWMLTIALTWLQAKGIDQWPAVLKSLRSRFIK
ncbi:type III secretion system YscJ/HrcJ family lipoprotein [Limnobacter thiooxidans]|uniref:type III secretion system inner membrane ring lipoprotein SctJ n=1 Tax=Limnobacter TaxID=131079 RepID=UPI00102E0937|nr:type III secretion inner membrane ring lipoprotein SctJ [Limnobacter sp.]MCZ8016129.1 type III secretion inner membrane ring lipoprotein SctJ [Limnobacter sp.]RZS40037.1 type III secretion system YscJ/HrcJ family lipoprotein [Limnobacter thiooxidans]